MVPLSSLDFLSLSPNLPIFPPIRKMVPLPSQDLSPLSLDVPGSFPVSSIVSQDYSSSSILDKFVSSILDKFVSSLSPSLALGSPPDMASMLCPASHPISSHWGQGGLETNENILSTLQALVESTYHLPANNRLGTFQMFLQVPGQTLPCLICLF